LIFYADEVVLQKCPWINLFLSLRFSMIVKRVCINNFLDSDRFSTYTKKIIKALNKRCRLKEPLLNVQMIYNKNARFNKLILYAEKYLPCMNHALHKMIDTKDDFLVFLQMHDEKETEPFKVALMDNSVFLSDKQQQFQSLYFTCVVSNI